MNTFLLIAGTLSLLGLSKKDEIEAKVITILPDFEKYDYLFKKYGQSYQVPWRWLKAIAMNESSLGKAASVVRGLNNPNDIEGSKSSDGKSWGLMQVTLTTANELRKGTTVADLNNPEISIELAAKYINKMIGKFGLSDRESVIRAYNGGPGFRNTLQGQRDTPKYYNKFVVNLNAIMEKQPGKELEYG